MRRGLVLIYVLAAGCAHIANLTGVAKVLDGDTIQIGENRVRLEGIDAPESRQECERKSGGLYPCGEAAIGALRRFAECRIVRCQEIGKDRYGRILATCDIGGVDIGGWMVEQGHAVAYRRYSKAYIQEEESAKSQQRGIWQGRFIQPEQWRRGDRLE